MYHLPLAHFPYTILTHFPYIIVPFPPHVWHFYPTKNEPFPPLFFVFFRDNILSVFHEQCWSKELKLSGTRGLPWAWGWWRKIKQMQPMWLCIFSCRPFEETFKNAQWRKVKQLQPMWLCIFSCRPFEETFKNAQWRKVKQMQSMWLCIFSCRPFEETFENTQRK